MDEVTKINQFKNKHMDIILLFIFIDKLEKYDKSFYYRIKNQFISYWLNYSTGGLVSIKDLNLNLDDSLLFIKWFEYMNLESVDLNKLFD